jgi:regulator of protease activity HflC (stomatin/prohibitin superfamily)
VATERNEFIRGAPFDVRPQFYLETLKNVITADRIPLEIEVGISYQLKQADNLTDSSVIAARIKEDKDAKLFPISKEMLRRAAFNVADWHLLAQGACKNMLRDQIMAHTIDELFNELSGEASARVNQRQIKIIELAVQEAVNKFTIGNVGVEITGVDVRQITLPKEAMDMYIKSRAEADAIRRIEESRNTARGELVTSILSSIVNQTNRQPSNFELGLATIFARLSRRELTDDVLGHQYVEVLKALAEGKGTNIFNATPNAPAVEPGDVLPELYAQKIAETG